MNWKHIFARKDLEALLAEAAGEHRLHRVLGPWSLTALGVGCIIGAGIFVMTGRAAALDAGPAVIFPMPSPAWAAPGRLVLRRVRRHGPRGRQRLHLCLHHAGRNLRLDHRLGLDPGIRHGLRHGGLGLDAVTSTSCSQSLGLRPVPAALSHDPFSQGRIHGSSICPRS